MLEPNHVAIIESLRGRRLTTLELDRLMGEKGIQCPDGLARTLNVMRRKGLIRGEVSTERGGWVWWVEDQP
jgi:uncharacterized membrane-anchored protein